MELKFRGLVGDSSCRSANNAHLEILAAHT